MVTKPGPVNNQPWASQLAIAQAKQKTTESWWATPKVQRNRKAFTDRAQQEFTDRIAHSGEAKKAWQIDRSHLKP